jgi:putative transcriptional regulator
MDTSLANHLLIAMPSLLHTVFEKSVIFICEHHVRGTVGLMINRPIQYPLSLVFEQLQITPLGQTQKELPLLYGGPLQPERGFVLHRPHGGWRSSLTLIEDVTVTTSNDIVRAMAENGGPEDALMVLGYTGWKKHQLELEVMKNLWLVCPFKKEILYEVPFQERWKEAACSIGVDIDRMSRDIGHA